MAWSSLTSVRRAGIDRAAARHSHTAPERQRRQQTKPCCHGRPSTTGRAAGSAARHRAGAAQQPSDDGAGPAAARGRARAILAAAAWSAGCRLVRVPLRVIWRCCARGAQSSPGEGGRRRSLDRICAMSGSSTVRSSERQSSRTLTRSARGRSPVVSLAHQAAATPRRGLEARAMPGGRGEASGSTGPPDRDGAWGDGGEDSTACMHVVDQGHDLARTRRVYGRGRSIGRARSVAAVERRRTSRARAAAGAR